jgi:mutator protein MutT
MKTTVVAKSVVTDDNGQVLLIRRSQSDVQRPGQWDFPGGGVEPGESFLQTVSRELQEEAGITASPTAFSLLYAATALQTFAEGQESVTKMLFHIRLESRPDVVLSPEHDAFEWVSAEQALQDFPHPFYATGLRYAIENGLFPQVV